MLFGEGQLKSLLSQFNRLRHSAARHAQLPPITVPHSVIKRRARKIAKSKASEHLRVIRDAKHSPLVIACKRKEFNHYNDNRYGVKQNEDIPLRFLASGGWLHYKSKGDYFTINTHSKMDHLDKTKEFENLGLNESLIKALRTNDKIIHPSHIQSDAIPAILEWRNVICAAETGCGKTLAYLLPLLHHLMVYREQMKPDGRLSTTAPRAVIMVPSRELAEQVETMAENLTSHIGLSVLNVSQGSTTNRLVSSLRDKPRDVDIVVATPGSLTIALRTGAISPALVNHVVIDEADTLMDNSFNQSTVGLLRTLSSKASGISGVQIILASATMPRDLHSIMDNTVNVAGFVKCTTDQLHHMLGHVSQQFIRISHADKTEKLLKTLKASRDTPTMVFTNSCGTASFLDRLMADHDLSNILLHSSIEQNERLERYKEFKGGDSKVLVCSDIASRGVDTTQVGQVINYDFPYYISDYIHRVGRVGRLGSEVSGKVINFIGHRPEVSLVWQIERAVRSSRSVAELPRVHANIKKHVTKRFLQKHQQL